MTQNLASTQPGKKKRAAPAKLRLTQAYKATFTGHGSQQDAEIVLSDLADVTGFYKVSDGDTSGDKLRFQEGMRFAFARILSHLRMTDTEMAELEKAARVESLTSYE